MIDELSAMLAYIDPGSGSLLLQFLIAGIVGTGLFFRNQFGAAWTWIKHKASARRG